MIVTVTLNPAVDRTVLVEDLCINKVNRVKAVQRDAGGKGINVSKTIKALGEESRMLVVLGGKNGDWISSEVQRIGIALNVIPISGETRENIKIVDYSSKQYTDLNEPGPTVGKELADVILNEIYEKVAKGDYLVLSGSALPGIPEDIFKKVIERCKRKNIATVVDVDGNYLKHAINSKPNLIKPNIDELEDFLGKKLETIESIVDAARSFIMQGVEYVVVSRGADGLLWVDKNNAIEAKAIKVDIKSTVGAGDAVVAALVVGLSKGLTPVEIVRRSVATAASVIMNEGTKTGDLSNLKLLEEQVSIRILNI